MTEHDDNPTATGFLASGLRAGLVEKALEPVIRAISDEISSARHEINDRVAGAKSGLIYAAVGAILALVSIGLLGALGVVLLALTLPLWAAIAIVLVTFLVAAAIFLGFGIHGISRGVPPVPRDTIDDARAKITGSRND